MLGLNKIGYASYNDAFTAGVDLPWLQDTDSAQAWEAWGASWRDLYVLDPEGQLYAVHDLNSNDLGYEPDYQALTDLLLDAAGLTQR